MNFFTVTPTGNRLLGRPRRRWETNIRMDLKEIGIKISIRGIWLIQLKIGAFVQPLNAALQLQVP